MEEQISKPFPAVGKNTWKLATIILSIVFIFMIIYYSFGSGVSIGAEKASEKFMNYVNQDGEMFKLLSINESHGLYLMDIQNTQGTRYLVYMSKDGYAFFPQVYVFPEEASSDSVVKYDRPIVELYIFSYCPAGSASLDSLAPVANMLKDSADFKVRFFSNMHGEHELQQNMIQACIQSVAGDKYWNYADQFYEKVYTKCAQSGNVTCDMEESVALMDLVGIDSEDVLNCVEQNGEALYAADISKATDLQLQYSPSFIVNEKYQENMDRSPEGIKEYVCSSYTEAPAKCDESLSEQATSAGNCG
ncbi:MAG: hypothetical protein PHU12_03560 [Candidatus Aenigmarchaeota archaeon]|nr:hypothetical protein [Candidatus Aenigmarchaeota archaeon]